MPKTYFNQAVLGNSSMLACLTERGELVRLFWPNIDYPQHMDRFAAGVFYTDQKYSTAWLHEDAFDHVQSYVGDTNILKTVCTRRDQSLKVVQTDYVLPDCDIFVREYEIENTGEVEQSLGFAVYSSAVTTNPELRSSLFDFDVDALIHYRHGYYLSVSADLEVHQFQLGNNAFENAGMTELYGNDAIGMMHDGALTWQLGVFRKGERKKLVVCICASDTLRGVKKLVRQTRQMDWNQQYTHTSDYWTAFIRRCRGVETGRPEVDRLYKRSLLVFKLMSDRKTGGLLAAPEMDEEFTRCGRYAYCWGRDAAFITGALDKCGLGEEVDRFYRWAVEVQEDNGSWQQRYHMDGNLAPSWGLQVDETGTILWGMLQHFKETGDKGFLVDMWESACRAADFLTDFIDRDTGLPAPSFDLWEERFGEHAYSSAAVYGGLMAVSEMAGILGSHDERIPVWKTAAESIKASMERYFWKDEWDRFIRSIRVKLNPWGTEWSTEKIDIKINPKNYYRDVMLTDGVIDVSLLGLCIPFGVFDVNDSRIRSTAGWIERNLVSPVVGGIKRYEHDAYIGGNPWVLATLWVALFHTRSGNFDKAREYFEWAVKSCTGLDLLPEQVDRESGKPAWVLPLTWSHAMFVLVLFELLEAGEF